ncbi:DUF1292 domain-containing protein [Eubacteriales bacterium OttesenSCG-928-A19]|nr:DUF1292 domain-containing protein [Eubacteriales bacterium OttesenSCG-928-A19]
MDMDESKIVELVGEDGTPVLFEHLMTLEHGDGMYLLLTPAEPETPDEEGSVIIMRIDRDAKGQDCYIIEEDEEKLDAIFERFMRIMSEEEDDLDEDDEADEDDE